MPPFPRPGERHTCQERDTSRAALDMTTELDHHPILLSGPRMRNTPPQMCSATRAHCPYTQAVLARTESARVLPEYQLKREHKGQEYGEITKSPLLTKIGLDGRAWHYTSGDRSALSQKSP